MPEMSTAAPPHQLPSNMHTPSLQISVMSQSDSDSHITGPPAVVPESVSDPLVEIDDVTPSESIPPASSVPADEVVPLPLSPQAPRSSASASARWRLVMAFIVWLSFRRGPTPRARPPPRAPRRVTR